FYTGPYAVVEFPPEAGLDRPAISVVPTTWLEESEQLCWWPSHLKAGIAVNHAILTRLAIKPGFTQCQYSKILRKCSSYKEAAEKVKRFEENSDWESAAELSRSSRGRHIRRIAFDENEDQAIDNPAKLRKMKTIKAPPQVPFSVLPSGTSKVKQNQSKIVKDTVSSKASKESGRPLVPYSPLKRDNHGKTIFPCHHHRKQSAVRPQSIFPPPSDSLAPSPTNKSVSPSPAKSVFPSPTNKSVSPSPAKSVSPSPAKSVSPSPAKSVSPSPAKSVSPSPAKSVSPSASPSPSTRTRSVSLSSSLTAQSNTRFVSETPTKSASRLPMKSHQSSPHSKSSPGNASRSQKSPLDVLKEVCRDVKKIQKEQTNQDIVLEEILQRLKNRGLVLTHPKNMPDLPLDSYEALKKLELSLQSKANAEYLAKRLAQEGGNTVPVTTYLICKKALNRKVAKYFSLRGRAVKGCKKKTFDKLHLYEAIK
ncbi:Hypothetical predicted protein, partial [Olea europaea subsp. europaea]